MYVTEPVNKFLVTLNPTTVGSTGFEPESNVKYKYFGLNTNPFCNLCKLPPSNVFVCSTNTGM